MTVKEIQAWVMVLGAVVISAWVALDAARGGVPASLMEAAWKILWAVGYVIVFNIFAVIVGVIIVSVVKREEVRDERADERDRLVNSKAMRNGYFVLSIGVVGVLVWQALGLPAELGPYALYGVSMLAGGVFAASQIVYYRIG